MTPSSILATVQPLNSPGLLILDCPFHPSTPRIPPPHHTGGLGICVRYFGPAIAKLYATGLALGTVYSVPPLRLKRFAVSAFLIIAFVRGFLLNFGVYQAVRAALGLPFVWSPAITCVGLGRGGACRPGKEGMACGNDLFRRGMSPVCPIVLPMGWEARSAGAGLQQPTCKHTHTPVRYKDPHTNLCPQPAHPPAPPPPP